VTEAVGCPRCHRPVPPDAPFGECPACLLLLGLADTPDGSRDWTVALTAAATPPRLSGASTADAEATLTTGIEGPPAEQEWPDIPGYKLIDELGVGGGGTVYLAKQLAADGRLVALKVIHGTSRQERERMTREMRALGRLTHPNVVTLFDADEAACGPYFTMEYLQGGSLARRIDDGPPTRAETARIVEQVARAVQAAHDLGILHRDLKPSNVLLGTDGTAKVADFGLAKLLAGDETPERLTLTNHLLGTPSYMAPEQAGHRHSAVGPQTDVYGLGGILFHCLTGRPPFRGETRDETLRMVLTEELVLPRSINESIPLELEAICVQCLEKEAGRRYGSAAEVADELARWSGGSETHVRPLGRAARFGRRVRRHRRELRTLAAAIFLPAIAVTVAMLLTRPDDPMARARRELERRLRGTEPVVLIGNTGTPAWYRWQDGATVFADSEFHDGACCFQTLTVSRLELIPGELAPPEFVLEADVRHDETAEPASESGLYFFHGPWETTPEYRAVAWVEVGFNDYPREKNERVKVDSPAIYARARATVERAEQQDPGASSTLARLTVEPAVTSQHPWRIIRVRVAADGLRFQSERNGVPITFLQPLVPSKRMTGVGDALANGLFPDCAHQPIANRLAWGHPGAIGLYVIQGKASFRNVRLTPIRDP
jgi:serine/threonine-protein kinase